MHAFLIENESQLKLVSDVKIVRSLLFMVFSHLVFRFSQALCVCAWFQFHFPWSYSKGFTYKTDDREEKNTAISSLFYIGNIDVMHASFAIATKYDGNWKCEVNNV